MVTTKNMIKEAQDQLQRLSALEILQWATKQLKHPIFATSLGQEDQVLTDLITRNSLKIEIITLDTGRLFPQTYDLLAKTEAHYDLKIKTFFPQSTDVEEMISKHGINLFKDSTDLRKKCCLTRKVLPLRRALQHADAWICGLRREQSTTRRTLQALEWDEANGVAKINPLNNWSIEQTQSYLKEHDVPYNPLHDQGYTSIGCACCTRAIKKGEDIRSGRWWWERPEHKECGLHVVDGKLVRSKQTA